MTKLLLIYFTVITFLFEISPVLANDLSSSTALPNMGDSCYGPTIELTITLRKAFVEKIRGIAFKAEQDHGIPAPILAAMAINESGYGTTQLAIATNNVLSYKWNSPSGPDGRLIYTLTCQPKEDRGNRYVIFRSLACGFGRFCI